MAVLKKNQVNQILFTMVDKTDFVTLETSLASNFTIKRIGVNHGSAAANISTLSRAPSKVGSGLYRLSLEANATNYDYVALRIAHASALTQILVYEMRTYDDTDTYSQLSDVGSNVLSYLAGMSNILSAVYVDTADISNVLSNVHADLADLSGIVSDFYSDFGSRVPKEVASKSLLSDVNSNLLSYLAGMSDTLSAVYVDTADISNILSNTHADLANLSGITSDIYSLLSSRVPKEVASKSLLSDVQSDLASHISGITVTIGPNDVSDIISGILAGGVATQSKLGAVETSLLDTRSKLVVMSGIQSDIYSLLSDMDSNFQSRIPKEVASKSLLSDVNSNLLSYLGGMSDILSAVYVDTAGISDILSNVHGDLADLSSIGSNIYSLLSDLNSNLDSRIPKEVASKSLLSDVQSNLLSYLAGVSNTLSTVKVSMDIVEDINRNKMEITDANGNLVLYEDDDTTPKYSVNACVTDDATTTIRKRLA